MPQAVALHGNQGKVLLGSSTIAELTGWTMKLAQGVATYVAVSSGGWQRTVRGNKKGSGTLKGKYVATAPIDTMLQTDSIVALVLYHNASQRWKSTSAMMGEIDYGATIDGQPGEVQEWSCSFESDGPVVSI